MPGGLASGQLVDERYALEERLGEDALGTTWRAHDRGLGRTVCLRDVRYPDDLFTFDPATLRQALLAARLAIRLDHPGAVHVYDAFLDGDRLLVVTEWTATRSLAELVARKGPLTPKRAAAVALDLLDPLAAAHARNLVHGSLTPDGVLVPERGPAQLAGFGLAPSFLDDASRAWIDVAPRTACLAPEQVEIKGATAASDLWALGATLYFAVEGAFPFPSPRGALDQPPRPAAKAGALREILERLLSREPAWRPSLDDLRPQLADLAGVPLATATPATADDDAPGTGRRRSRRDRRREDTPDAIAEPDWDAAVVGSSAAKADEDSWGVDWSADGSPGASDVWLPELEPEDDPAPSRWDPWARDTYGVTGGAEISPSHEDIGDDELLAGVDFEVRSAAGADSEPPLWEHPAAADFTSTSTGTDETVDEEEDDEGEGEGEDDRRFRSSPSWPPEVRRRSAGIIFLCSLVMVVMVVLLVTNGRLGRPRQTSSLRAQDRPVLATDPALVPREWIAYRHPSVNFTVSYPPGWTLREEGSLITVRDQATGTELRVDYRKASGPDPVRTWEDQERDLLAKHPNDYKRLQLSPASYLGHVAGLWEYTYLDGNLPVHAVDLGFLTDSYAFTLSFRAPASTWDTMLGMFHGFLSSVRAPE